MSTSADKTTNSNPASGTNDHLATPPRQRSSVLVWLAVLMIVCGVFAIWMGLKYLNGGTHGTVAVVDTSYRRPPANSKDPWLKEFTLTERSGKTVSSADLVGHPSVTSFFFASCPGYCMQQNQKVAGVAAEYGPKGVKFVSISVDPDNDTPAVLRDYAHKLKADENDWLFLTGEQRYIARVGAEMFSVVTEKQSHSEKLVVSDKWGNIRGYFYWNNPAEMADLRKTLDKLLAETEEPAEFKNKQEAAVAPAETEETSTSEAPTGDDGGDAASDTPATGNP
jgi:protein SCO1/2